MTALGWALIAAIVLAVAIYVIALIRVRREGPIPKYITYQVLAIGLLFILYLVLHSREIEPADWAQILLMLGLVVVTGLYAFSAFRQANASVKMAKEMRVQRLSEAQPYLLLRLNLEKDVLLQWEDYNSERRPTEYPVTIHNAGKGPAINLWAALWHRGKTFFVGDSKGYLAPNEEWQVTISRLNTGIEEKEGWLPQLSKVIKGNEAGIIAVEYQDVHKRKWASYLRLERHIDIEQFVMEGEQNIVEIKNNDS